MTPAEGEPGLLLPQDLPAGHRSGYVAVVGRPNVGKSTLINRFLGQKIAIVSPKPQTTRNSLLGIVTRPDAQVIFVDTPGVHTPMHRLGQIMVEMASSALADADVVLWMVDLSTAPTAEDHMVAKLLARTGVATPQLLVLNKLDLLAENLRASRVAAYAGILSGAPCFPISAIRGDGVGELLESVVTHLPLGPRYFPEEQVTDQQQRFLAAELIREQVLVHLRQEVPHSVAVGVMEYKERREDLTYIAATIYVERDNQKGIVVGHDGQMLKRIGQAARKSIEESLQGRVYLDLWVKVRENWRSRDEELRRLGYATPSDT
jgi:GTPase